MATSQSEHYIISIYNSNPPVKDSNGNHLWSVDIVVEQRVQSRQLHDPVRIIGF